MPFRTGSCSTVPSSATRFAASALVLAAALLSAAGPAHAQAPKPGTTRIFVTIDGSRQGKMKAEGGAQFGDRIPALGLKLAAKAPRDRATGQASGKREWQEIEIIKDWSAATPQIIQALQSNELLKTVVIEIFRTDPSGQEVLVGLVRLTDASVSEFTTQVEGQNRPDLAGRLVDTVKFTFRKIEISHPIAKTAMADDWTR